LKSEYYWIKVNFQFFLGYGEETTQ
jgi:hypothetical protein